MEGRAGSTTGGAGERLAAGAAGAVPGTLRRDVAATLAWWRESGVDNAFHDQPAQWLSPAQPMAEEAQRARVVLREAAPPADRAPVHAPDPARWPQTLAGFADWWLTEPALDEGRTGGRVPPRGPHAPELMLLVDEPEDDDDARLLSGPHGRFLDRMLQAMAIAPERAYLASALPRHTPMADWPALAERGFGRLLAHHVTLVAPRRIVAFGTNILSLLGNDPTHNPAKRRFFAHEESDVPMLALRPLPLLLMRSQWKADAWRDWLDWSATD